MKARVEYIDVAKGISITLVVLYHSSLKLYFPELVQSTALFRMPLFFFLSGLFFSYAASPGVFFAKKAEALLKPYFIVLFGLFFVELLVGDGPYAEELGGIFYGVGPTIKWTPLWFLTHLFCVYMCAYVVFRFCKLYLLNFVAQSLVLVALITLGSVYIDFFWQRPVAVYGLSAVLPGLPFSLDLVPVTLSYFIAGFLLRERLPSFRPHAVMLVLCVLGYVSVRVFTDANMNLNFRKYVAPLYTTLGAVTGIYAVLSLSWLAERSRLLKAIPIKLGEASLFILIFHYFIVQKADAYLSRLAENHAQLIFAAFIAFLLSLAIPLLIRAIVLKSALLSLAFFPVRSNKLWLRIHSIKSTETVPGVRKSD